jgi:DNA-binding NtrC family response regulator
MATALIVDDEAVPREALAGWLRASGFDARTAPDSRSALTLMEASPADVAVVDVRMPSPDGMWLADQLRTHYPTTAVVMYTGLADLEVALWCLKGEVFDYLVKPFSREALEATAERALAWHHDAVR